jgi:L-2-hydroxyglutarate oxidase LhgO
LQGNERLKPAYSGIRPKVKSPSMDTYDFVIESHGIPGFVALYGIESPGLTSCLALADHACCSLLHYYTSND